MYKNSEEVFDKLVKGTIKYSSLTKSMNRCIHKRDIDKWVLFARAQALYKIWRLDNDIRGS